MNSEEIALIISIITVSVLIFNFINGRKKDVESDTANFTKINMKLDEICRTTTDIKVDARATSDKIESIIKTQVEHDTKIHEMEKQIRELKGEIKNV